jgi:MSHA biogenesis protein MshJ
VLKSLLTLVGDRINGRSLRERVVLLVVCCVMSGAFAYLTLLSPTLAAKDKSRREVMSKESESAALLTQIQAVAKDRQDPDRDNKARIEQLKQLLVDTEAGLNKKRDRIVPPEKIGSLLEEVLARHGKLVLVDMKSLPAKPLFDQKEEPSEQSAGRPGARKSLEPAREQAQDAVRGIYRHGIEIRVRGSYLELVQYLVDLEKLPMQVFWSDALLESKDYPDIELKVTLFTVSFDKVWLTV